MPNDLTKQTIHIDAAEKRSDLPDGKCPTCGEPLETGFGLAGGGYGVCEYCASDGCNKIVTKTNVNE